MVIEGKPRGEESARADARMERAKGEEPPRDEEGGPRVVFLSGDETADSLDED